MVGKRIGYIMVSGFRLAVKMIFWLTRLTFGVISLFLSLSLFVFRIFLIFLIADNPE